MPPAGVADLSGLLHAPRRHFGGGWMLVRRPVGIRERPSGSALSEQTAPPTWNAALHGGPTGTVTFLFIDI